MKEVWVFYVEDLESFDALCGSEELAKWCAEDAFRDNLYYDFPENVVNQYTFVWTPVGEDVQRMSTRYMHADVHESAYLVRRERVYETQEEWLGPAKTEEHEDD